MTKISKMTLSLVFAVIALAATPALSTAVPYTSSDAPFAIHTEQEGEEFEAKINGGGIKPLLCGVKKCGSERDALEWATYHAWTTWGGNEVGESCEGPFKDKVGEAQWACYGLDWTALFYWQYNVGPYGEGLYHTITKYVK